MTNFLTNFKAVKEAAVVSTDLLPFTEETLRACARNACGRYNTSWACPPASGKAEEMKKFCLSFPSALLFSTCGSLEDSFDVEGMNAARSAHTRLTDEIAKFYGIPPNCVFGAEACALCRKCTYPNAPCRFPARMKRTVESLGIDVVSLSVSAGLKYCNGANTVTYFSLLLSDWENLILN